MKILKMFVLVIVFALNAAPFTEVENTVSFMFPWDNPDPCGGEECSWRAEQELDSITISGICG